MPQSIRLVLYFRGPAMAQTALKRTRPAKIVFLCGTKAMADPGAIPPRKKFVVLKPLARPRPMEHKCSQRTLNRG